MKNVNILNNNSDIYLKYGYLMLPVSLSVVPEIKIGAKTFFLKKMYHVSLLNLENLSEPDQKRILIFSKKYSVKLNKITEIYRLVKKEDQQSIIVLVRLHGLKKLISAVNKHFGYKFVYPPTHITLYTLKDQYGIPVNSKSEYAQISENIEQKYFQKLSDSFRLI